MNLVLRRADGSERKVGGYRFVEPPAEAKKFDTSLERLPPKVDLRPFMTTVEDQGQTNSCAANATAGAYEYLMKRHLGDESYDVSRLFIYFNARAKDGGAQILDEGSVLANVIEGLKEYGACSEESWPFDSTNVNTPPAEETYQEAAQFLIEGAELVPTDLSAWKTALAAGFPIVFGVALFDSFDKQKVKGMVPEPTANEAGRESHGGHAMLCVGYSDADEVFIVRNSWGTTWGDGGYCYIPYRYLMNPKYNFGDSWIIKNVDLVPAEGDEAGWGDDSNLLEAPSVLIAQMTDEEWSELLDGMGDSPFEQRLAAIFLRCAASDGHVDESELTVIAGQLEPVFETLGIELDPEKVLSEAANLAAEDDYIEESIELLGRHLPAEALASITSQVDEIAAADGEVSEGEDSLVATIIERWQLAAEDAEFAE